MSASDPQAKSEMRFDVSVETGQLQLHKRRLPRCRALRNGIAEIRAGVRCRAPSDRHAPGAHQQGKTRELPATPKVVQGDALIRCSLQGEAGRRSIGREGCQRFSYHLVRLVFFHAITSALVLSNLDTSTTAFFAAKQRKKFGRFAGNKSVKVVLIPASLLKASPTDAGLSAVGTTDPVRQVALASDVDPTRQYFPSTGRDGRF